MLCCGDFGILDRPTVEGFKPLHCGAMLCCLAHARARDWTIKFQTPSLRGNALLGGRGVWRDDAFRVSNPFIAGQCSAGILPRMRRVRKTVFQTPSLRGNALLPSQRRDTVRA